MKKRVFATSLIVISALVAIGWKYQQYLTNPWTRDGQVRAQIVQVTPRITGPIIAIHVSDNSEVKAGQQLFEVDPRTYQAALAKAQASLVQAETLLKRATDESHRGHSLARKQPGSISQLMLTQQANAVESAKAGVMVAKAALEEAKLNLSFTQVTAPVDGYITNLNLRIGSQVVANQPVVALVDKNSYWIEGFFKETDINDVVAGASATVNLMSYHGQPLSAKVDSIGYGIAHKDGSTGVSLLPNVNPTFQWIRLAQRIPVRIRLTSLPANMQLRVGSSASVIIHKTPQIDLDYLLDSL
ncbi:HlyD family secretion protein [Vibrio panuliri]|uniref:Efflux transporter periplasmic adaptor subunit n=1 Tax=Vibrio panuliri TaxID=1381081 RepID=A0A1Q9HQT6_9VIBR|nr:HlyD family secretion protein [Vibrio panuliri]KAB1458073.1 HlyD family secretion protein [Vibrio panuliri]OLQ93192.1 efflux transporter periplasmic adaptor subunit [Vibrio panuliri]OLQ95115.1 efflux transporter periplasmic adaptor subunit [Vibrio panuliri]